MNFPGYGAPAAGGVGFISVLFTNMNSYAVQFYSERLVKPDFKQSCFYSNLNSNIV